MANIAHRTPKLTRKTAPAPSARNHRSSVAIRAETAITITTAAIRPKAAHHGRSRDGSVGVMANRTGRIGRT